MLLLACVAAGDFHRKFSCVCDDFDTRSFETPLVSRARFVHNELPVNNGIWLRPKAPKIFYTLANKEMGITRARMSTRLFEAQKAWAMDVLRTFWAQTKDYFVFWREVTRDVCLAMCWVTGFDVFHWDAPGVQLYFNFLFEQNFI